MINLFLGGILISFLNYVRGGFLGDKIIYFLSKIDEKLKLPSTYITPIEDGIQRNVRLLESAWRSVGDRLFTVPLGLLILALLLAPSISWYLYIPILLIGYLGFLPGWVWIGMGNNPGNGETWEHSRQRRPNDYPGLICKKIVDFFFKIPSEEWSDMKKFYYDLCALSLRGFLLMTLPLGIYMSFIFGTPIWMASIGLLMGVSYVIAWEIPSSKINGPPGGEIIYGFLFGWFYTLALIS